MTFLKALVRDRWWEDEKVKLATVPHKLRKWIYDRKSKAAIPPRASSCCAYATCTTWSIPLNNPCYLMRSLELLLH